MSNTKPLCAPFQVWVGAISRGPNGNQLLGNYQTSEQLTYQDDVGRLVRDVCATVPHGVLCFFPSYKFLEKICNRWKVCVNRVSILYILYISIFTVRTEPSKPSNVLEFDFSVQVPSIVLEFNSMFSNVLETKCLENAVILAGILALLA